MEQYYQPAVTSPDAGRFFFPTLTPPFAKRATYRYTARKKRLGIGTVTDLCECDSNDSDEYCPVRNGVVSGFIVLNGRLGEFCKLLDDLGRPVEHVVLPCNALEHKAPMQVFLKKYPNAQVWISPGQYGPFGTCGRSLRQEEAVNMGYKVDGILGDNTNSPPPPWANEFDVATLYVDIPQNAGPFSEVAFLSSSYENTSRHGCRRLHSKWS